MFYSGYCNFNSSEELALDDLCVQKNREQLCKNLSYAFLLGNVFVILFDGMLAWADDLDVSQEAKKDIVKRLSNVIGCGAIMLACGKASQAGPQVVQAAANEVSKSGNPKLIAAFACGATVAWCAKYAIFDK